MEYQEYLQAVQDQMTANNQWSALQAQKQMDFQKEMSDTAHQREVADLKAAGLNPVLSAHTNGASTPSGAMATNNGDTSAFAGMLATILDTENANARANLMAAARSGSGSASGLGFSDLNGILQLFGLGLPNSSVKAASAVKELASGLDGKYFNHETGINYQAIWNDAKNLVNTAFGVKKDESGVNWKTSSATNTGNVLFDLNNPGKYIVNETKEGVITKVFNTIKNGIKNIFTK